jgi:hypothetical protein
VGVKQRIISLPFIPSREGRGYFLKFEEKILKLMDIRIM